MSAPTWRFAVCRVMGHSGRFAPRAVDCEARQRIVRGSSVAASSCLRFAANVSRSTPSAWNAAAPSESMECASRIGGPSASMSMVM